MPPRNRTRAVTVLRGTRTRFGTTVGAGQYLTRSSSTCSDITGQGDNAPLTINSWESSGGIINNTYYSYYGGWFQSYIADVLVLDSNFPHLDVSNVGPSNVEAATQAAARTSPSAAYVDVTANVLELADIVQLIKTTGETLLKKAASMNLKIQFGMLPLVRDLDKLCNFQEQVMRRVQVIEKLRNTGSYRKTVSIGSYDKYSSGNIYAQSADATIIVVKNVHTHLEVRAHCRWVPSVDLSSMNNQEMRALAAKAVRNTDVNFSALWEAMPWSWLIDWCGNVGTYLKAQRNVVPATLQGVTIMRHTKTVSSTSGFSDPSSGNRTMTPIGFVRETKLRQTSFVAPSAHWPFLSANQMGILASLSVR